MTDFIEKNFSVAPNTDASLVAILLCTYNGSRFIAEQLDSLESQTHQNWFIIASDDGSTDQTLEILQQYQVKWPAGKLTIRSGPKKGFCQNYLSLACDPKIKADYYAFCDQDDVWLPAKLAVGISSVAIAGKKNSLIPILYGGKTIYADENLNELCKSASFNYPKVFRNALVQTMAGGNTLVFNNASKALLERAGYVRPASHDWWLYLLVSGAEGICIFDVYPQVLYRQHKQSLVGGNQAFFSKAKRLYFLLGGQFKALIDMNVSALIQQREIISKNSSDVLESFIDMRSANFLMRMRLLGICGLFRQTRNGTVALYIAIILNKI